MKIAVYLALLIGSGATLAKESSFLNQEEKAFLKRVRERSYVATQAKAEMARKSERFYQNMLAAEVAREVKLLEGSLESAWATRDALDNEELFFRILERELAPRE